MSGIIKSLIGITSQSLQTQSVNSQTQSQNQHQLAGVGQGQGLNYGQYQQQMHMQQQGLGAMQSQNLYGGWGTFTTQTTPYLPEPKENFIARFMTFSADKREEYLQYMRIMEMRKAIDMPPISRGQFSYTLDDLEQAHLQDVAERSLLIGEDSE